MVFDHAITGRTTSEQPRIGRGGALVQDPERNDLRVMIECISENEEDGRGGLSVIGARLPSTVWSPTLIP